jgi:YfiH family protein
MDVHEKRGIILSDEFSHIPGLIHGFSTRAWGDMRMKNKRESFLQMMGLEHHELYYKVQMHSDLIHSISAETNVSSLSDADGAIVFTAGAIERRIALTVRAADCVPILFVDPKTLTIGIVHAGWQGTVRGIVGKAVAIMCQGGSDVKDILVWIGPHIGPCCYSVDIFRAEKFKELYASQTGVVKKSKNTYVIDLGLANSLDLQKSGILQSNIHSEPACTSCSVDTYFSYRKDTQASYGVMMGVLAWK